MAVMKLNGPPLTTVLKKGAVLLLLPLIEYLALRYVLHCVLGLRIGWGPFLTDYDLFLPLPGAFLLFLFFLEQEKPLILKPRPVALGTHFVALGLFLLLNGFYAVSKASLGFFFPFIWWGMTLLVFASSIFSFSGTSHFFNNPKRWTLVLCTVVALTCALATQFGAIPWQSFSPRLSNWVCGGLHPILGNAVTCDVRDGFHVYLIHPLMAIRIAKGCGGLDGYLLMCSVVAMAAVLSSKKLSFVNLILFWCFGFAMMSVLNVVRIGIIFVLGIKLVQHYGREVGTRVLETVFHSHLGWILYAMGLYQLSLFIFSWEETKQRAGKLIRKKLASLIAPIT